MGDGAAEGTSKSESAVESGTAHLGGGSGLGLLDDGVDLGGSAGHFGYLGFGGQRLSGDGLRKEGKKSNRAGKSFATEVGD